MNNASLLPGGSSLTEEQEALLALFLEKEGVEKVEEVEQKPIIILKPEDRYKPFPLTDVQLAYVIGRENAALGMSDVSSHVYFELETRNLDLERYQNAWRKLIERHDMMRSIILPKGQQQVLEQVPPFEIQFFDLSKASEEEKQAKIEAIRDELGQAVKAVDVWPMYDIYVTRLDEESYRIHLSMEGLLGDVLSFNIILSEVKRFYEDPNLVLEPLDLTFRDYVLSLENRRNMDSYKAARAYWEERISTLAPAPAMPTFAEQDIKSRPKVKRFAGGLAPEDWTRLKETGTKRGLSPTSILLAAFAEALRLWNREPDFCLNLTLFNRLPLHPQIEELIGDFTDTLLLEAKAAPDLSFEERAKALRDRLWADLDNRQFSGLDVLRELNRYRSEREQQYMPVVFTSTFLMADYGNVLTTMTLDGNPVQMVFSASQTPQLLIDHQVFEDQGRLGIHWDVRSEYFQPGYLEALFAAYTGLLERLARDPAVWDQKEVVGLPPDQASRREQFNATAGPVPEGLLHGPFLKKAQESPDAPAVITSDRTLTYGEVLRRAAAVAAALEDQVQPGELVAVAMRKGWEQIVAVLGILCAGGAYLPVDPTQPAERLALILKDGKVRTVLTQASLAESVTWPADVQTLALDTLGEADPAALLNREPVQSPKDLAYVIYTSGSTGQPKGVMIEHEAALNTVVDINTRFHMESKDRVMGLASLSFDLSVWDIFGTLAAGAALVLPDAAKEKEPSHWLELVEKEGITVWNTVPAMMQMLVEYRAATRKEATKGSIRLVLLSGDWLPLTLPGQIREHFDAEVISLGGATEAGIWSILYPIETVDPQWKSIPYGRPMLNQGFHVLNQFLQPCPEWVPGPLYISGTGLARGYWHDQEKTEKAFVTHPVTGERLYRTGDVGYFHPDGYIVLLGREDNQCKINGFRVELGEIEYAMRCHPGVKDAVAIPVHGEADHLRAFVVLQPDDHSLNKVLVSNKDTPLWEGIVALDTESNEVDTATAQKTFDKLDLLYDDAIQAMVFELGLFVREGDVESAEECVRKAGISPRYERWMKRALTRLQQLGFLEREGEKFKCVKPPTVRSFAEVEERNSKGVTGFMLMSAVRLVDILQEKLHSAELYATSTAKGVYPAMFRSSNALLKKCMQFLGDHVDGELTVLEVGSGHGGTTGALLPVFNPERTRYFFTDISTYFLQNAADNFKDYPFLNYQIYNLDNPPEPQGLALHSFDAIVASSVLHDTRVIDATLSNLLSLLKPGGMLFIVEQTRFVRGHDLGMGLQQGFDVFEDTELRPDHPLISAEVWEERMRAVGFQQVHTFSKLDAKFALGMDLLVAKAPDSVELFDGELLAAFLRERLPSYMVPTEYTVLQHLPVNHTGKIDRKALQALGGQSVARKRGEVLRTETEKRLAALWSSVLMVEVVDYRDNFFELGGDSLLATVLIGKVHETFQVELSVLEIYTLAALGDMARRIDSPASAESELLTAIQPDGDEIPWFCVPGAEGSLLVFAEMAHLLKDQQIPMYGFRLVGLDGKEEPLTRIEDMAARYIEAMRKVRPEGPYHLVGFCMGGFIAYEMAAQLERSGAAVERVILIDSYLLPKYMYADEIRSLCIYAGLFGVPLGIVAGANADPSLRILSKMSKESEVKQTVISLSDLEKLDPEKRLSTLYDRVRQAGFLENMSEQVFQNGYTVLRANLEAMHAYKPTPWQGCIDFFRATGNPAGGPNAKIARSYWSGATGIKVYNIPGTHLTVMKGESIRTIVDAVQGKVELPQDLGLTPEARQLWGEARQFGRQGVSLICHAASLLAKVSRQLWAELCQALQQGLLLVRRLIASCGRAKQ